MPDDLEREVRDLARRVAAGVEVLVCPPVTFGYYPAFVHFPGSVNLAADTFREVVEQIISSLAKNGAQRFVILNTGVSTTYPLALAANTAGGLNEWPHAGGGESVIS